MIRCIIICAGEANRWNNYLNKPKHLIEVDKEPILKRTIRLIHKFAKEPIEVFTVVKEISSDYEFEGSTQYVANLNPDNVDADKFLSSQKLWNKQGRTIVFYGDVFFTEEAMKTIMHYDKEDWRLFARFGMSSFTGCPWGECFAQSFYPEQHKQHLEALYKIRDEYKAGHLNRCGGWEHYRAMEGFTTLNAHLEGYKIYNIDDFTDDFDLPQDYERWKRAYDNRKV